jgi:hypothetical protein
LLSRSSSVKAEAVKVAWSLAKTHVLSSSTTGRQLSRWFSTTRLMVSKALERRLSSCEKKKYEKK